MTSLAEPISARRMNVACCLAIIIAIALSLGRLKGAEFTNWDDPHTIVDNPLLHPPTWTSIGTLVTQPQAHLWVPATYTLWWMLARASSSAHVYHVANLIAHMLASLAVFALLRRLLRGNSLVACIGALIFALHPVQVESVAWISGGKDVFCGLFSAVALWQYTLFAQRSIEQPIRSQRSASASRAIIWHYALAIAAWALAMLSKPTAVTVPLMFFTIDALLIRRRPVDIIRAVAPALLLIIPILVIGFLVQRSVPTTIVAIYLRPFVAIDSLSFYLTKLLWPARLAVDYGWTPRAIIDARPMWFTWIAPAALLGLVIALRRRVPMLMAGIAIALAGLLPVLGIVSFDFQEFSNVGDHYLYLPMIGVAIALAGAIAPLRSRAAITIAILLCVSLGVLSNWQARVWQNSFTLFQHTLDVNPKSWASYLQLSSAYEESNRHDEARDAAANSLAIRPTDLAWINYGSAELSLGNIPQATDAFEHAVHMHPTSEAYTNLANAYGQAGRFDDAIRAYELALKLDRSNHKAALMLIKTRGYVNHLRGTS